MVVDEALIEAYLDAYRRREEAQGLLTQLGKDHKIASQNLLDAQADMSVALAALARFIRGGDSERTEPD